MSRSPTQVSTRIVRPWLCTTSEWIDRLVDPSSSRKCGASQPAWGASASGVAAGSSPASGSGCTSSTTLVTVTSPIVQRMAIPLVAPAPPGTPRCGRVDV